MKNIFFSLKVFFCSVIFSSCSTIEFISDGPTKYHLSSVKGSEKIISTEGMVAFYLWGALPKVATVNLNDVLKDTDVKNPSMVKIERFNTFETVFWTMASLGFYMPEAYRINVYSKGMHDEK